MAARITREVRRSARLSWLVAIATVLGAALLVLTPRRLEPPGPVDLAAPQVTPTRATAPSAAPIALFSKLLKNSRGAAGVLQQPARAPVQMRLTSDSASEEPVDIRF